MPDSLDPIVNLMKRRGFLFQSAEIYGGAGGIYDLGPLGVELSNNIKQLWWKRFIRQRDDMVGLDTAILTPYAVLKASGHVDSFSDPLIECGSCHIRLRADHYLDEEQSDIWLQRWATEAASTKEGPSKKDKEKAFDAAQTFFDFGSTPATPIKGVSPDKLACPNCGEKKFGEPRQFNMMFQTNMGAVVNEGSVAYLRPETCQGIFVNFKNVLDTSRRKMPFGIGQIGKAFRNEITIGNSLFRVREFEQAEIEYFVKPGEDGAAHDAWLDAMEAFLWNDMGIAKENLRRYEHPKESLSHYSSRTVDLEYKYPFGGFGELWGCANRTDYDLRQHQEHSGKDMTYFDEETKERYLPYTIEPSVGLGRLMLTILVDAYKEYPEGRDGKSGEKETVLHIAKSIAPIKVAVLPLMKKDGMGEKAREIHEMLKETMTSQYDESGAIGRRYRRQDEIGTPYCVTVDYDTLTDGTVTVRDRDSMKQERVAIDKLTEILKF